MKKENNISKLDEYELSQYKRICKITKSLDLTRKILNLRADIEQLQKELEVLEKEYKNTPWDTKK